MRRKDRSRNKLQSEQWEPRPSQGLVSISPPPATQQVDQHHQQHQHQQRHSYRDGHLVAGLVGQTGVGCNIQSITESARSPQA